jgi:predicted CXXCH cytochrome family protein
MKITKITHMNEHSKHILLWNTLIALIIIIPLSIIILPQISQARVAPGSEADSAKECAICHYRWVYTFFIEQKDGELAPFPEESTVKLEERCFSCHDGGVMDDREKIFNDRGHKTDIMPSDKIRIPEDFPLDEEGKIQCFTCHMHHQAPTDSGMLETWIFLRTPNENSEFCMNCHQEQKGGPETGNHSMEANSTLRIPKEITTLGGHVGTDNRVICESCHIAHGGRENKLLVLPTEDPVTRSVICEVCHGEYPSLAKDKSLTRFSHSVDVIPDTASMPETWSNGHTVVKGKNGQVVCRTCHIPHKAVDKKFLLAEQNREDSLCLKCHNIQQYIKNSKHDLQLIAPKEKNLLKKKAKDTGPCSVCHLTHRGTGPFMWARKVNDKDEPMVAICESCHTSGRCGEEVAMPESGHTMGVEAKEFRESMTLPFYTAKGEKDDQGAIYCSSCHNTHQWDPINPDDKGSSEVAGDISNSFLRASHQGSVLCLECHRKEKAIEKTDHDLAHSLPEEKNMIGQSPGESGICGSCHLAHGGSDTFMWARTLEEDTQDVMTRLCLECHRKEGCAEEKQIGEHYHPIEVNLESSMEATLPLFSSKGKQDIQGKVFCSTCHNPHQWAPDNPNKKGEDGTSSDSFLRLTSAGSSPLCVECHQDKGYIEGTDHDLRVTAPEEQNNRGLLPQESGICEQCHATHNAPIKQFLWGREVGPPAAENWKEEFTAKGNIMVGFCTNCHLEGKCAGTQIPEYGLHPSRLYMALMEEKSSELTSEQYEKYSNHFPIFTEEGERSIQGNIVCTTCHDAHLWDAHRPQKGSSQEIEGDASSSFLRKDISFTFCSSCHGEDALYKFKYFHLLKGRTQD